MKSFLRSVLRKAGVEVTRYVPPPEDPEREFERGGRVPWSRGYGQARDRFQREALGDPGVLEAFRAGRLPAGFGHGFDERCVEYGWLLSRLPAGPLTLLDAGSTLNHEPVLDQAVFKDKNLHVLTLAPEQNCFWQRGISYLFADLRDVPIRDGFYDHIACLSTLEHVGCYNVGYSHNAQHAENRPEDFVAVMRELRRVLKPGGSLFLTVPYGAYEFHGAFQQFDGRLLAKAVEAFGPAREVSETYYRYGAGGWQCVGAADCADCRYVDWVAVAVLRHRRPDPLPVEPDRAAAARAVACVQLTKA